MIKEKIKKFIPEILISFYHFLLSFLGAVFYFFPSRNMKVIGITGTSGKTTTVDLVTKILENSGKKVASLSSIKFKIAEKEKENMLKMTMPGRFKLQKFLKQAKKAGCQYVVLEVTSEGIKQHRHRFIDFDVVSITNLSKEHIESHGGFENYKKCKGKLFKNRTTHVVNLDDKNSDYFLSFPSSRKIVFTTESYQREEPDQSEIIKGENIESTSSGIKFSVEEENFEIPILGKFNVCNALCAISIAFSQNIFFRESKKALKDFKGIPGRMEVVIKEPFSVIVDYAITPVALEKVYKTLTSLKEKDLIAVLGSCGGGRDKWKRPVFGKIASKYCKYVFITNEDPYEEDPMEIINQVAEGAENAEKILDRRDAIREALKKAEKGDIVVITGKGCEPWMCVKGGKKIPWDDRKIVKEEFKKL